MKRKEVFWGLLFIIAAVLILMNQFGYFEDISVFKLVAAVIFVGIMIRSIIDINFWGVFFPAAFICILFADELNIHRFIPWPALLTAFLLSLGLSILFGRPHYFINHGYHGCHDHWNHQNFASSDINEMNDNIVNCSVSFGEAIKYVNSANLEKAYIKCSFGEANIYFDHAMIPSGNADIYLDVSFGDAQLFIPRTWKVKNDVHIFFGDMGEKNGNNGSDTPVVTIHGNISFGDTSIIYV